MFPVDGMVDEQAASIVQYSCQDMPRGYFKGFGGYIPSGMFNADDGTKPRHAIFFCDVSGWRGGLLGGTDAF